MSSKEIIEKLHKYSKHHLLDEHDAFVCCILSHGGPGVVYGTDGVAVEMNNILLLFRPDQCEFLAGKPKLFFVQACRGDKLDLGIVTDGKQPTICANSSCTVATIPSGADFCVSYAAEPGHVALRDVICGTPYVCALCEAMVKQGANKDFHYILMAINLFVFRGGRPKANTASRFHSAETFVFDYEVKWLFWYSFLPKCTIPAPNWRFLPPDFRMGSHPN